MKSQNIDTLQWTPSERLRKVLFIKKKGENYDKSFAEALTSAKRCYDVRIVEEFEGGLIAISYLYGIGVNLKTGITQMMFSNGGFTWTWDEPSEEQSIVSPDIPIVNPDIPIVNPDL